MTTQIFNSLPPNTIVPVNWDLFVPYFNRLYEDVSYVVNHKDFNFYSIPISSTPTQIPNMPLFGAYLICVSGENPTLPTLVSCACKASNAVLGVVTTILSQPGTDSWAGNSLTITPTTESFDISHDRAGVSGNFNIRIIGTQGIF